MLSYFYLSHSRVESLRGKAVSTGKSANQRGSWRANPRKNRPVDMIPPSHLTPQTDERFDFDPIRGRLRRASDSLYSLPDAIYWEPKLANRPIRASPKPWFPKETPQPTRGP